MQVCFHEWKPVEKKNTAVNSLVFHSSEPTWLFCGTNDGVVSLWDVGTPALPTYDGVNPRQLLKLFPDYGDVYNIAWSGHQSNWLLAGTAAGLVGWNVEAKKVTEQGEVIMNNPEYSRFRLSVDAFSILLKRIKSELKIHCCTSLIQTQS